MDTDYWVDVPAASSISSQCFETCAPLSQPQNANYVVRGTVKEGFNQNSIVRFLAANPPDYRSSFAGSGLPFASADMAYEGTPNSGAVQAVMGVYEFGIQFPNSFYVKGGTTLLPPHVLVKVCSPNGGGSPEAVMLGSSIPNRTLTSAAGSYTRSSYKERNWDSTDLEKYIPNKS